MQKQLGEIEDQILRLLAESAGNILDDEQLITTLAQSKVTSDEINAKVAEALSEDAPTGDVTVDSIIPADLNATATLTAREPSVADWLARVRRDPGASALPGARDDEL
jgi:hypothetical protein